MVYIITKMRNTAGVTVFDPQGSVVTAKRPFVLRGANHKGVDLTCISRKIELVTRSLITAVIMGNYDLLLSYQIQLNSQTQDQLSKEETMSLWERNLQFYHKSMWQILFQCFTKVLVGGSTSFIIDLGQVCEWKVLPRSLSLLR